MTRVDPGPNPLALCPHCLFWGSCYCAEGFRVQQVERVRVKPKAKPLIYFVADACKALGTCAGELLAAEEALFAQARARHESAAREAARNAKEALIRFEQQYDAEGAQV